MEVVHHADQTVKKTLGSSNIFHTLGTLITSLFDVFRILVLCFYFVVQISNNSIFKRISMHPALAG